jgi:hypothetical protein
MLLSSIYVDLQWSIFPLQKLAWIWTVIMTGPDVDINGL